MILLPLRKCTICNCEFSNRLSLRRKTCGGQCAQKYRTLWREAYFQKPEVQQKRREARNTPEAKIQSKIYHQKYFQLPEIRDRRKLYLNQPEVLARNKAYHKKYNAEYYLKRKTNKM